ncbi:malto-oligosyltrehalose synthase [uncultured Thiohalocapsa sp.]|uniref:malto-oligosyltrehalose synthase n=1 Tax=uncultured Thiohalocapsa sp. TaxID=768990 RepID=UPI0025D65F25|nr:malto-oligosyltrehalose synthase [uncultured Thiohalocapsa sp.]
MASNDALQQLCAHFGIAERYVDVQGREHHPDAATRRALLHALGVGVGDPATEQASLAAAIDADWRRRLPPVLVYRQGDPAPTLLLTLPETADQRLRGVLTTEQGAESAWHVDTQALVVVATRELDGAAWRSRRLPVTPPAQLGYHRIALYADTDAADPSPLAETTLIVAPRRCWQPDTGPERAWGLVTQLPLLRSARNWGIGDFTDLTRLVELAAGAGAGMLALNPLHALFLTEPERCDPYGPASRRWLNPLYIDVEAVPELAECEDLRARIDADDFQARLRALRGDPLVDYAGVTEVKLDLLSRLFRHFRSRHLETDSTRARAFRAFCAAGGEDLQRFACFQALAEHLAQQPKAAKPHRSADADGFAHWPAEYRDPQSPEVRAFAREHADRVDFFAWLQWLTRQQLDAAAERSQALGMAHGLCLDLAVGAAPDGADRWSAPADYVAGVHVGAPPDDFSPKGQDWRVLAWHPQRLRGAAYAPAAHELRANMRAAGALRIDHVMGLMRLFLVPAGTPPAAASYLAYPSQDLLGVLALESVRNRCMIIGEDLGTVPDAVRAAIPDWGILSTRVFYFERDADGGFLPAAEYPTDALVTAGTHDLPPLAGFWTGVDLEHRRALDLFPTEADYTERLLARTNDRARLLLALDRAGLLPDDGATDPVALPQLTPAHISAVQRWLARTPARLLLVQTADLLGETEQVNLPGSGAGHPNWRRRQPLELEHWLAEPAVAGLLEAMAAERGTAASADTPAVSAGDQTAASTPLSAAIPRATYRLQLHAGFGFAEAAALVPYLAALGVSHVYCSPYLKARPGSTHGYDVVAHDQLNPELGSRADFAGFCAALTAHGMGQILDMVPNHVGIMGADNAWWLDVLENGQAAAHAPFFDVDWHPLKQELHGKVLVPVLGDHYGDILDAGELVLAFEDGAFHVGYYEHRFPIDPREYPRILAPGLPALRERLGATPDAAADATAEMLSAFESLVTAFGNLPPRDALDADALAARRRDKALHKRRLAELCAAHADLHRYVQDCLRDFNGAADYPADTARLHDLLEAQAYRLAHWRVAADEINYRRFFDINDLAALRMEHPAAFDAVHELVLSLIGEGCIAGLRIDHPDGLYDPAAYFRTLQQRAAAAIAPTRRPREDDRPLYLVAEKILGADEHLRMDWAVHGTTGYDFAALCDGLCVDAEGLIALADTCRTFGGCTRPFADETYAAKREVMRHMLSSELHLLASELARIAELDPHTRDYTLDGLREALMEVSACFPVYRTYLSDRGSAASDRHQVLKAVSEARRRSRMPDLSVFELVRDVLLTDIAEGKPDAYRARVLRIARKFQQYTAPVTAKGVEDTAFYRWHRLVSLNEVGAEPDRSGTTVEDFHRACARRRDDWPHAMLAGSTHDAKRSEDVRARLHLLSELPAAWAARTQRWALLNRRLHRSGDAGERLPETATEYLFYQTLLGIWPLDSIDGDDGDALPAEGVLGALRSRVASYMLKAAREAKLHTAWTHADGDYEAALTAFVEAAMDADRSAAFLTDFAAFARPIARLGMLNSLAMTLLRLTAPGVPDIYQGTELWDLSLVDPDNRRPVDFHRRRELLGELRATPQPRAPAWDAADGRGKLHLIQRTLALRAARPALFTSGSYQALAVSGPHAAHVCAFARVLPEAAGGGAAVTVVPRCLARLALAGDLGTEATVAQVDPFADAGWEQTFIDVPGTPWLDQLGGSTLHAGRHGGQLALRAAALLRRFPVALLCSTDDSDAG